MDIDMKKGEKITNLVVVCKKDFNILVSKKEVRCFKKGYRYAALFHDGYYRVYGLEYEYNAAQEDFEQYFKIFRHRKKMKGEEK